MIVSTPQVTAGGAPKSARPNRTGKTETEHTKPRPASANLLPKELVRIEEKSGPGESIPTPPDTNAAEKLQEQVARANAYLQRSETNLEFVVGNRSGLAAIKIVDKDTGEVIRQIPREEMGRFADRFSQLRGLLFETKG